MIFDFLKQKNECKHTRVPIDVEEAYCPDCGALIKNQWYLVRCCCCNIKRTAHTEYNKIKPNSKFCPNCGCDEFYIEELDNLTFIDVNYAILKKIVIPRKSYATRQIWIEKEEPLIERYERKLLSLNNQD